MTAYYNEIDEYVAQWLRDLITAGHIAPGDVDTRSIEDVHPDDLRKYTQCHFFAGIGGWSLALRLAGWPDDRPVWTGSCPCQPFSAAGKGKGVTDERHLWPAFYHLLGERRPTAVYGEQVASRDAEVWLDLVQTDVEALGYAFGALAFPASGIGAPHIRDRTYWVAHSDNSGPQGRLRRGPDSQRENIHGFDGRSRAVSRVEFSDSERRERRETSPPRNINDGASPKRAQSEHGFSVSSTHRVLEDGTGPTNGQWRNADWLLCRDGKWRPVEPGTFPLAHGVPNRVGRLRAYGNAIVPQEAAAFIVASQS